MCKSIYYFAITSALAVASFGQAAAPKATQPESTQTPATKPKSPEEKRVDLAIMQRNLVLAQNTLNEDQKNFQTLSAAYQQARADFCKAGEVLNERELTCAPPQASQPKK